MSFLGFGGAWVIGVARTGFGVGFVAEPERLAAGWVGPETAASPTAQILVRSLGVREVIIGAGTVYALARRRPARAWFVAGALADLSDVAITLAARAHLPKRAVASTIAVAGGSAATGLAVALHRK